MGGLRVGRIAGFELRIHWSTLVIFALLVWSLAAVQLPDQAPGSGDVAYGVAAVVAGIAFYFALLAHEVSHAIVARREGIDVESLTLWMLGGVAALRGEPDSARADFKIAAVGPAVSLAIAIVGTAAALILDAAGTGSLIVATVAWLAGINGLLGLFNLVPAAPLDGGRILRAALWAWRYDRTRAAIAAARAGVAFGYGLVALGIISFFRPGVGGLWFILLGWFLINAANAEQTQAMLRDKLGDLRVQEVMTRDPVTAPADTTVARILDDYVMQTRHSAFPLLGNGGELAGLVTLDRLRKVPRDQRDAVSVRDVACPADEATTAMPDERLVDVLPRLNACSEGRVLVATDGRIEGILTPTDVTRAIERAGLRD